MKIVLASPHDILFLREPWAREVKHQKARLLREGQIEPTVVKQLPEGDTSGCIYVIDEDHEEAFHYSTELIKGAQELDWPTVQVTF